MNNSTTNVDGITSDLLFSTPVFKQVWPDAGELNQYLRELILSWEQAHAQGTREYSNVGGWHSPINLQESWDPDLRLILDRCRELAVEATNRLLTSEENPPRQRYALSAWANVSRQGDYNVPHVHMSTWSTYTTSACLPTAERTQERAGSSSWTRALPRRWWACPAGSLPRGTCSSRNRDYWCCSPHRSCTSFIPSGARANAFRSHAILRSSSRRSPQGGPNP